MKTLLSKRILIPVAVVISALTFISLLSGKSDSESNLFHTVNRGDLIISVIEGGTLEAVNETVVKNTIDGESRIISLIPEGTYVEKGDLLVEFDAGTVEGKVEEQRVKFESRQAALVTAENDLIITKSTVDSDISEAKLDVQFATKDLEKFEKLERAHQIRDSAVKIDTAEEALKLAQQKYEWSIKLAEKGFETMSQVDRDKLEVSRNSKALQTAESTHEMLEQFDLDKTYSRYLSDKKKAISKLERVKKQGESKIAQKQAAVNSAKVTLRLTKEGLDKKIDQLKATKVYAPQSGLLIYAKPRNRWSNDVNIAEGALVRNRKDLVKIPDTSSMKVKVKIHESIISQVKVGQKVFIVLDSLPDKRFQGEVSKVGILPDSDTSWRNPDLKVYSTEVVISDAIEGVKPGVSARTEIIIDELKDALTAPIQAVTTLNGEQVCYIKKGGELKPIKVEVGLFNTKHIEIKSGFSEGDEIILNPPLDSKLNLTGEIVKKASSDQ